MIDLNSLPSPARRATITRHTESLVRALEPGEELVIANEGDRRAMVRAVAEDGRDDERDPAWPTRAALKAIEQRDSFRQDARAEVLRLLDERDRANRERDEARAVIHRFLGHLGRLGGARPSDVRDDLLDVWVDELAVGLDAGTDTTTITGDDDR